LLKNLPFRPELRREVLLASCKSGYVKRMGVDLTLIVATPWLRHNYQTVFVKGA